MPNLIKQKGFTLIELVMVILLLGIIGTVMSKLYLQGLTISQTEQNLTDATWQGQLALQRMVRDIREVRSAADITTNSSTALSFTDINGNAISYTLSGTSLLRNSQTLAAGISSLAFQYYDKNGNVVSGATNVTYITITLNITQNKINSTITTGVNLRDLSS